MPRFANPLEYVIKAEVTDPQAKTFAFAKQKTMRPRSSGGFF
jgi:hypothetical protein